MNLLEELKAFVATAETGSFTEAARRLGISNRLTSKYVANLEVRIGARLLQRTTRQVGLTPTGQELLARAPKLLDEFDDLLEIIARDSRELSGHLRISAPVTYGEILIQDLVNRFSLSHPDLTVELRLDDTHVDLAKEGFDLAFRIGTPETPSLKVRKLGTVFSRVVASPEYLQQHGTPLTPEELSGHKCILDTNRRDTNRWLFTKEGEDFSVYPEKYLMVNSARIAREWAIAGRGITICPDFVLEQDFEQQRLVPLLSDYSMPNFPLSAVYLAGNVVPAKVKALIDFAVSELADRN